MFFGFERIFFAMRRHKQSGQLVLVGGTNNPAQSAESILTDSELAALGLVTVNWSLLESGMNFHIALLAQLLNATLPRGFWKGSFTDRMRGWRDLVENEYPHAGYQGDALAVIERIGSIKHERDRITHNPWGRAPYGKVSDKSIVISLGSEHRETMDWRFTEARIRQVARKVFDAHTRLI